jgi:LysR family nitrogen assimilation transcriptional regulator
VRSKSGVRPTEAGRLLYKHAQVMLRQLDLAEADIRVDGTAVSGQVAIGLAPFSTASTLAVPLLKTVRERYPNIVLQIHENIGGIISEMIMTGQIDLAFIHDPGEMRGVEFEPILSEDLFLVCPESILPETATADSIEFKDVAQMELMMPRRINTVRQLVDLTFRRVGGEARVVAEIESIPTLGLAVGAGLAATILPWSVTSVVIERSPGLVARRIVSPTIPVKVSMCTSQQFPLSEPAVAVRDVLAELAHGYADEHSARGVRAMQQGAARPDGTAPLSSSTRKKKLSP